MKSLILVASSPQGLLQALELQDSNLSIWCGSDAISEAAFENLRGRGVTRFTYPLAGETSEVLQDAAATISEHHPGATIWFEVKPSEA